jgi:hypothetical protein
MTVAVQELEQVAKVLAELHLTDRTTATGYRRGRERAVVSWSCADATRGREPRKCMP